MFNVNDYIRYQGRVLIVTYVGDGGIFAEDVDWDESFFITPDEFDSVVLF